jgi:hypothetical protein
VQESAHAFTPRYKVFEYYVGRPIKEKKKEMSQINVDFHDRKISSKFIELTKQRFLSL